MITVTEKQVGKNSKGHKKAAVSMVLGMTKAQIESLMHDMPKGMWFIAFPQVCGTFGADVRTPLDELQKMVAKACG